MIVGEGSFRYELVEGWEQIPNGWSHGDVAGVATDSQDRVYVANRGEHPVIVYDRDGRFLYASFGSRGLYCYDLEGKPQWQRDLGRMSTRLGWGEAVTPVVHGDSVLLNWDQEANSSLICLEAATGRTK